MQNTAEKQEETPLHRFTSSTIYAEETAEDAGRGRKRLLVAALAIGAFVALLAFSYNKSRQSGGEAVVATVEPKTPYTRIRPDNPEGAEAPYQEMEVYKGASSDVARTQKAEKLAPLPEQPLIKAAESPALAMERKSLSDIADAREEQAIRDAQTVDKTPIVTEKVGAEKNMDDARTVLQQAYQQKSGVVAVPLNIKQQPEKIVAATTSSSSAIIEESAPVEEKAPEVLTIKKPVAPVEKPTEKKVDVAKPQQKVVVKKAEPVVNKAPATQARTEFAKSASTTGSVRVQLGAFSSEALARNAWKTLSAKNPAVLGMLTPRVVSVNANGKTLYRLQAGMLGSRASAEAACTKLKAANQTCIIAK